MKRYITFVLVAMSLVGLVACSNDNGIAAPDGEAQVALRFESSSMTRADEVAGINALNENLIKTIDCYFYLAEATKDTPAVWHQQFDFVDEDNGIAGVQSTATVTDILMPSDKITAIFGTGTTGKIYAIANYAGDSALPTSGEGTSMANLKAKVVEAEWLKDGAFQKQPSFVMDSEMVEITKDGNTIKRTDAVPLTRTAAKVELTITDVEEVVSSTTTNADGTQTTTWYVPAILDASNNPTGAYVTMYNARTEAGVGGIAQTYSAASSLTLANYGFSTSTVAGALYKQTNPFYTYPHTWESSEQEASLLLVVYWQATDKESKEDTEFGTVGDAIPCYYEIPIGAADNKAILRNHIYQIGINVGTLGSFVKEEPKLLTPSYMVVDWGTGDISAKIKGQRYLVVDKHSYTMENTTSLNIPFVTSHECEIVEYTCTQEFLFDSDTNPTKDPAFDENADGTTNRKYSINIVGNNIVVKHGLNNDLYDSTGPDVDNGVFDFTPYTITFTIRHKDATTTFKQAISITQNPAMYGTADENSDYSNDGSNNPNGDNGFVWVNGYQDWGPDDGQTDFGGAYGSNDSSLNAVSMYTITTTALAANSKYVIGDPRTTTVDNLSTWNGNTIKWASAPALYGESPRTLMYYYPTDANINDGEASHTYNMIAPKFRVSSAYGAIASNQDNRRYYENVEGRCASYQEDGYPAGRWRLPTAAEFEIINTLTNKGLLPTLYVTTMDYWCAHGYGRYNNTQNKVNITPGNMDYGSKSVSVRCVYDEWYWGSEPALKTDAEKDQFTWGDMPR